jgi:hypothetical protein
MLVDRGSCGLTTKAGSVPYNAQAIAKKTSYFCAILQIETCPVNFVRNSGTRDVCPSVRFWIWFVDGGDVTSILPEIA